MSTRRRGFYGLVALAFAGCAAPAPPPVVASVVEVDTAARVAANEGADAGPPLPPDVTDARPVEPPAATCDLGAEGWQGSVDLHVAPFGRAFAALEHAREAHLLLWDGDGSFLRVRTGSGQIGGYVALGGVHVAPTRAIVFGGFFVPSGDDVALTIAGVQGGRITVRATLPDGVELTNPGSADGALARELGCDDVAIVGQSVDVTGPLVGSVPGPAPRDAVLAPKRKVMLSLEPKDPPVARISTGATDDDSSVKVLEDPGGRSRIAWASPEGVVFGWVASTDLRRPAPPAARRAAMLKALSEGAQFGMIGLIGSADPNEVPIAPKQEEKDRLSCPQPVRILGEIGGQRYLVGQLPALAPFGVGLRGTTVTALRAPGSLEPKGSVPLEVPSRDLVGCTPTTDPEPADPTDFADPRTWGVRRATADLSGLGSGVGQGVGFGHGTGGAGSSARKAPRLREGAVSVNGRLPPEVIQRIVRQNFGRFRLCYENGLRANPNLQGRVSVKFEIDRSGAVTKQADGGSDLPDGAVVSCVVRGFGNLSFPQPEGGTVTVIYPILFAPGD